MRGFIYRLWPYFAVAFNYLCTSPYHRGLNNPNEMVRVYMTKALVDEGTPSIDAVIRKWGGVDDKAVRNGKMYSSKAPLQSLTGVPVYAMLSESITDKRVVTTWLRIFGSAIYGMAIAWLFLFWSRKRSQILTNSETSGNALGLAFAVGTMFYPYAITFTGHILAALTAGGTYLAVIKLLEKLEDSEDWFVFACLAGFSAGAAPFAEYPAALVAAPILFGGFFAMPTLRSKGRYFLGLAVGGFLPFGLGLWAHHDSWGAFYKTGYSFLENRAYVEVHGTGFFGVNLPKADAFLGSLFSPGTGLFFYSPILIVGLVVLCMFCFQREHDNKLSHPRTLAIVGLIGFVAEVLFISGHTGWRGGWTLGPRYIIGVVPILAVWTIEGLAFPRFRFWLGLTGGLSIILTGFASALYPHLSDVYGNPLISFVLPSYLNGEFSYGLAHSLGLEGHIANMVHTIPLTMIAIYVFCLGNKLTISRAAALGFATVLTMGSLFLIPESDPSAAMRENERLWGFWEPSRSRQSTSDSVYRARDRWRGLRVTAELLTNEERKSRVVPCRPKADRCEYGGQPWQHLKPDFLPFDGKHRSVLFVHPITGWTIKTKFNLPRETSSALLEIGLTDSSADSDNKAPVSVRVLQGNTVLLDEPLAAERGLKKFPLTLTATGTRVIELDLETTQDGARVLGFDLTVPRANKEVEDFETN
ncbi:MAG: hypothetical protein VYC39_10170 [Myxococcota bacterium]|nr:hypothetical protein [Myxococcota bacterium]